MQTANQYNINTMKRHILDQIELQGGFNKIRQPTSPADLSIIALGRNWLDGQYYISQHGKDALYQLYSEWEELK